MKIFTYTLIAIAVAFFFTACSISPEQRESIQMVATEMLANGSISQAQFDTLTGALSGGWSSGEIFGALGGVAATIAASIAGVDLRRGKPKPLSKDSAKMLTEMIDERKAGQPPVT